MKKLTALAALFLFVAPAYAGDPAVEAAIAAAVNNSRPGTTVIYGPGNERYSVVNQGNTTRVYGPSGTTVIRQPGIEAPPAASYPGALPPSYLSSSAPPVGRIPADTVRKRTPGESVSYIEGLLTK